MGELGSTTAEIALRFDRVSKDYQQAGSFLQSTIGGKRDVTRALVDVSFDIRQGEILGLVGQSGSGKSTAAALSMKLIEPTAGRITVVGRALAELRGTSLRRARKDFQIVFQDPYQSLNPRMRVAELIGEPLSVHYTEMSSEERRERVDEMMESVGLAPPGRFRERFPHELSGGQRQRAAIGRAVIAGPRLLIADEPVSMLDVSIRSGVLRLLLNLRERLQMGLLFITHDLAVARHICDRIAVMHEGRIVEMGDPGAIVEHPADVYTQRLIRSVREVPVPAPIVQTDRGEGGL